MAGALLGDVRGQQIVDPVDVRVRRPAARVARGLVVGVPAAQLADDVPLLAAQVAQPDGVRVDGVDLGQGVDQGQAGLAASRPVEGFPGLRLAAGDDPVDEAHDVERGAVDRLVDAQTRAPAGPARRPGPGRR